MCIDKRYIVRKQKIFTFVFFALLLLPLLHINKADISTTENRTLAPVAKFIKDNNRFNKNFGRDFNNWFTDRFFGRDILLKLNNLSFVRGGVLKGNSKVLPDKNGWLFYVNDNSLKNFANVTKFSDQELQNAANYLSDINNWCKKHKKQFYVFIMPDKNKIYGEHITLVNKILSDDNNRTTQLLNYLKNNTTVKVIYPYDALIANKSNDLLYYKNDTHWNSLGGYTAYKYITKQMGVKNNIAVNQETETKSVGDLTNMMHGIPQDNTIYKKIVPINNAICTSNTLDTHDFIHCDNPKYKDSRKLYALRDSYMNAFGIFLNNTFKATNYVWHYDIDKQDIDFIQKNNIDIVVLEIVERNTNSLTVSVFPKD